jgi:hypothetical protein
VRDRARHGVALGTSALLHGAILGYAFIQIVPDIDMPEIELEFVEVELLDPEALQADEPVEIEPAPPVLQPELPPEGLPEPEEEGESEEEPPEEEGPKKDLGKKKSRVDQLAPPLATHYMLLVPKKVRGLSYAQKAVDVVAPFPDFQYLITDGGFDPLRDFDHIVIASPDLRSVTQTFLAVDYKMSRSDLKAGVDRAAAANGETIEWIEENGILRGNPRPIDATQKDRDPRFFVLLEDKIALYVREEFLPAIISGEDTGEKTSANFVANLSRLKRFSARIPSAGFQWKARDLMAALKRVKGLPFQVPNALEVTAEAASDPEVLIRLEFVTGVDALAFKKWFTEDLAKIIDDNMSLKLTVKGLYDAVEVERSGKEVKLWAEFTEAQIESMLTLAAEGSARTQRKTKEDIERMRQQRLDNWEKREGGALPPAALGDPSAEEGTEPSAPPSLDNAAPPEELRR